jgi:S-DNA-T family DNA segregation ATPase FtsK/SpoIIIE
MQTNGAPDKSQYIVRPEARRRNPLPSEAVEIRPPKRMAPPPSPPGMAALITKGVVPMLTVAALFFFVGSQANLGSFIFILPTIVTGFITVGLQFWQYRQAQAAHVVTEEQRIQDYRAYLAEKDEELQRVSQRQSTILWEQNPPVTELMRRAEKIHNRLWERLPLDDDFLALRMGTAATPLCVPVKLPPLDEEDPLSASILALQQQYAQLPDAPVTTNLKTLGTLGLRGRQRETTLQTAFTLLAHLVAHHSPEVVYLYIISHHSDAPRRWEWVRWLPHVHLLHAAEGDSPRLSYMPETDDDVLSALSQLLRRRLETPHRPGLRFSEPEPHLIIVFDSVADLRRHQAVNMLLAYKPGWDENQLQASAIFIGNVPPQVNAQIELGEATLEYRERGTADANQIVMTCKPEWTTAEQITHLARRLAPLHLEGGHKNSPGGLPGNVRLVELLGATQPLELNLDVLYSEKYDPQKVMSFPIGLNVDARPQLVVLREDSQGGYGHHALLAGATGKGKSVTLLSTVLSLAASNSPSHLNFVLADFKGGASELARLRQLPHVVGFVTDLDEAYVERFRVALAGEVKRRQRLFESAPQLVGRQIQNIYEYNKAAPENLLPHLVIVIDEFAKAMQVNPEFKATLEKEIASQGRALGMHLILSSQKAVDFMAVRPNIEVRMSMQLQTAEDSRAIFNRDDAAKKLTRAGQAYLQVGDNQIFEMFQVARADTPYREQGANLDLLDDFTIRRLLPDGRRESLYRHKTNSQSQIAPYQASQLSEAEVLVEHIRLYCQGKYKPPHTICLPPLPPAEKIPLATLLTDEPVYCLWQESGWDETRKLAARRLKVPLGMLDLPAQQAQRPYLLDLTRHDGHFVVSGSPDSGKGLCLRSLVMALAASHPPADLLFYFVSRSPTLAIFEELPHCQAIVHTNEGERLSRLFVFLAQEEAARARRLRDGRFDSLSALREAQPELALPAIVVVFDDFAGFMADHNQHVELLDRLISKGKQADIHLIFSVPSFRGTPARYLQNSLNRLALGIKLGADTLEIFGQRSKPLPEIAGRGYVAQEQELMECQIAAPIRQPGAKAEAIEAGEELLAWVTAMNKSWSWPGGRRPLPLIAELSAYLELGPLWRNYPDVPGAFGEIHTATIGLDYDSLEPVRLQFSKLPQFNLILGPAGSGKSDFLANLTLSTATNLAPTQVDIYLFALKTSPPSPLRLLRHLPQVQFAGNFNQAKSLLSQLQGILENRMADQKLFAEQTAGSRTDITRIIPKRTLLLVDDVQQFCHFEELNPLLDRCMEYGRNLDIWLFLADSSSNILEERRNFNLKYLQAAGKFSSGVTFAADSNDLSLLNLSGKMSNQTLNQHRPSLGKGRAILAYDGRARIVQFGRIGSPQLSRTAYEEAIRQLVQEIAAPYGRTAEADEG